MPFLGSRYLKEMIEEDNPLVKANRRLVDKTNEQTLMYDNPDLSQQPYLKEPQIEFQFNKLINQLLGLIAQSVKFFEVPQPQQQAPLNILICPPAMSAVQVYPELVSFYNAYVSPLISSNPLFKRDVFKRLDEVAQASDILASILSKSTVYENLQYSQLFSKIRDNCLSRNLEFIAPPSYQGQEQGIVEPQEPRNISVGAQPGQAGVSYPTPPPPPPAPPAQQEQQLVVAQPPAAAAAAAAQQDDEEPQQDEEEAQQDEEEAQQDEEEPQQDEEEAKRKRIKEIEDNYIALSNRRRELQAATQTNRVKQELRQIGYRMNGLSYDYYQETGRQIKGMVGYGRGKKTDNKNKIDKLIKRIQSIKLK